MARIGLGPWGKSGNCKQVFDHSGFDGIMSIEVTCGGGIDTLRFQYIQRGIADPVWLHVGGPSGPQTHKIALDYPSEYLVKIEGYYGDFEYKPIIRGLKLYTNRREFGPYGMKASGDDHFELPVKGAKIVGFHGCADPYVPRLGVYVEPYGAPCPTTIVPRNSGPWGGAGGEPWDDGVYTRINKVIVNVDGDGSVLSLQVFYDLDGSSYSTIHPGKTGATSSTVEFKKEDDEYLERISGFFGPVEGNPDMVIVKALRFHSNKATYGPYGEEIGMGEFFSSSSDKGEVLGFYGRCGERLYAVGVRIKYKTQTPAE